MKKTTFRPGFGFALGVAVAVLAVLAGYLGGSWGSTSADTAGTGGTGGDAVKAAITINPPQLTTSAAGSGTLQFKADAQAGNVPTGIGAYTIVVTWDPQVFVQAASSPVIVKSPFVQTSAVFVNVSSSVRQLTVIAAIAGAGNGPTGTVPLFDLNITGVCNPSQSTQIDYGNPVTLTAAGGG
ncbi:MAG: hypothetical protein EXR44_02445, partial [Dehalococcoidia bacterium]|nr:hypothetical protein [Dehalococcoidia bacterium]